jgi:uncharacterized protein YgiM (DUF1202 family)
MQIDRKKFLDGYTAAFGAPSQGKTDGINTLLASAEGDMQITDIRWLAYMLATVKHECADTWKAIEEYGKGKGHKYGNPVTVTDPSDGKTYSNVYYGRGYVQLTWDYNYRSMGQALSNRLLYEPRLALDPTVAYKVMSYGMRKGAFTGKKLSDYINAAKCDYVNARRIINGTDQAERIAGYASKLEKVLLASIVASVPGNPVPQQTPVATPAAPASMFTVTAASLNVRGGPGASNALVHGSPLAHGAVVQGHEDQNGWKRITAQGSGVTGWVSAQYLKATALQPA